MASSSAAAAAAAAAAASPPPPLVRERDAALATTILELMAALSAKMAALVTLRDRTKYVSNVVQYCEEAYVNPASDKGSIKIAAHDYLSDALAAIASDVEANAANLDRMMALQAREAEVLAAKLEHVMVRLQLAREVGDRAYREC